MRPSYAAGSEHQRKWHGNALQSSLGDYQAFFERQVGRLQGIGIDVMPYPVGHLAFRKATYDEYLTVRVRIEAVATANVENRWNGRPISKVLLVDPLPLGRHHACPLIELILPPNQRDYPMGLKHVGFALENDFDAFAAAHAHAITEQQDQGPFNNPLLITFDDGTSVKFHRHALQDVVVMEGRSFDGFYHEDR